jgi:hypothetical protein
VIKISPGVYGDYYWHVEQPERVAFTRSGQVLELNFAARLNGEIEGTVYAQRQQKPLAGVMIELADRQGQLVQRLKTGFDGFYLFEKVPFGQYQVRISVEQLQRLNYQPMVPLGVILSDENDIASGNDFMIKVVE